MTAFDPDRHIDAMAPALGLDIRPEWRVGVAGFLAVAASMARLVEEVVDDGMAEGAPVYCPGEIQPADARRGETP
ncbi:DUF4089 domain-containing protein [Azospirillum griseum]|uniref:DUF4089 domain-containing protein n=1 Tax=Azospirillum griseum TaxID=2496639 RepID=A0A3S0ICT6_9PROT|nr:DUF4089 domain-containing protein [Azospirillum griseum]RTR16899.1 DUF4089 domain-containing protein [Azospirillum griseum]